MPEKLPLPQAVLTAPDIREILSVWVGKDGHLEFVIRSDQWSDPAAWGILLVDLARHVAEACGGGNENASGQALARVRAGFDVEWEAPSGYDD